VRSALATTLLGVAVLSLALPALAAAPARPQGPDTGPAARPKGGYEALNKLPDWGGVWITKRPAPGAVRERPQPKGKYLEAFNEARRLADLNNGETPRTRSYCAAPGLPGIMGTGQYPMEILFTPGRVTTLHEAWTGERRIFTDGRKHTPLDELDPSFYGESIGHWEGDTLVVDTVALKDFTSLDQYDLPKSGEIRVVERLRKINGGKQIEDLITIDDPKAYTKPWTARVVFDWAPQIRFIEYICEENNRNPVDANGVVGTKLIGAN